MTGGRGQKHIDDAFAVWRARSAHAWELDLSMLTAANIAVRRPLLPDSRAAGAKDALGQVRSQGADHRRVACTWPSVGSSRRPARAVQIAVLDDHGADVGAVTVRDQLEGLPVLAGPAVDRLDGRRR